MRFTDLFIRRPVLSMVISLAILVVGLRSGEQLAILQYPYIQNSVVTVKTAYFGADADVISGFITAPLENSIAQANGIDYMTSTSRLGQSTITVYLRLNYDPNRALTEINTRVTAVRNQLPPDAQEPTIDISLGLTFDSMYIGFGSSILSQNQITDYIVRVVQPKLQAVDGVQGIDLLGAKIFALRAWLDPQKLAAYDLTAADVSNALLANNYLSAVGSTRGQMVQVNLTASTDLRDVEGFKKLILREKGSAFVRLEDVATVTLGSEDYEGAAGFDGKRAVNVGIRIVPTANLLDVMERVRRVYPEIQAQLPTGLVSAIAFDASEFVNASIEEVVRTLLEALAIVIFVVFAFLGSPRSVLIPIIAIPLSLIGTFPIMLALGFSINLLTLLALVLAIGLVVDDAIIIVENVNRHMEEGMAPLPAALVAARELVGPIIAMTIVLVAVYVPIGFVGGLTGTLFTEFAFTLVGSVTVSAVIALTLSPMMSSRLLKMHDAQSRDWDQRLVEFIDRRFEETRRLYMRLLHASLDSYPVALTFAVIVLASLYFLFTMSKKELAPSEDLGVVFGSITPAANATLEQKEQITAQVFDIYHSLPEMFHVFEFNSPDRVGEGMALVPWNQRHRSSAELQPLIQRQFDRIAGARVAAILPPPLPGQGFPIQFVIGTAEPFDRLNQVIAPLMDEISKSGRFLFVDQDLKIDKPQSVIDIDRDKAASLGLTMKDVGSGLSSMLGGGYVNYFSLAGRSYKVIPQVQQYFRLNQDQLENFYIRTGSGRTVPLSTIVTIRDTVVPETLNHFQQINSATITGVPMPGLTSGEVLDYLRNLANATLPQGYTIDYAGPSRQLMQESSALVVTFFFALIIIFLSLAAQFESFRDPFIILVSVPMSICGALIFIMLGVGGTSLNIYTEVGLVTLIGLISKHGILIVEFANKLQAEGHSKRDAIEMAASIRLRPILMTTAAMVLGVFPLLFASGAGANSRFGMGLVIASGISIGTCFTLFVVPAVYLVLAAVHKKKLPDAAPYLAASE